MTIKHEVSTDEGLQLGGWTLDDWCLVEWIPGECGDGILGADEECDDGVDNSDSAADACRLDCRLAFCGDGVIDDIETCDGGADCDPDCTPSSTPPPSGSGAGPPVGELTGDVRVEQACICTMPGTPDRGDGWWHLMWVSALAARRRRRC